MIALSPEFYSEKRPTFTATFWVAVNHVPMFLIFLVFAFRCPSYCFPLLLYISKPKLCPTVEVCGESMHVMFLMGGHRF